MSKASFSLLHAIRTMAGAYRKDSRTDVELLSRYVATGDEAAFTTLMARHGPMVWSVCERFLENTQDVEEVYQTAFLALAQRAGKLHVTDTLGGWLHQVARRTALNVRKAAKSRKKLQEHLKTTLCSQATFESNQNEIIEAIHEELADMPEKLRVAMVLHYLEGKAEVEVAQILGLTKTATWSRITRGRALLLKKLSRKGVALGAAGLAALLEETASHAALPPGLVTKTVQAAAAFREGRLTGGLAQLAQEVLKLTPSAPPWWKSVWMITILCVGGLGMGMGGIAWRAGYFGTKADDSTAGSKKEAVQQVEKDRPRPSHRDRYGDPLPPGALARLGTTRFRNFDSPPLFTRDGKGIVACTMGGPALLCDAMTGRVLRKFGRDVRGVALSADGLILAGRTPDDQGGLRLWDVTTGKLLRQVEVGQTPWGYSELALSPDGKMATLANRGSRSCAVEVATSRVLWDLDRSDGFASISYSPDGAKLLAFDGKGLCILDARSALAKHGRLGPKEEPGVNVAYACSGDGRLAAFASTKQGKLQTEIRFWDVTTQKELPSSQPLNPELGPSTVLALSSDGAILAMVDRNQGLIRLIDVATGKERSPCEKLRSYTRNLTFSPNGKVLAAICYDHINSSNLHLWDVASGKEITPNYEGHTAAVTSVLFTSNDKEVVSGGADGAFRIWNAANGAERLRWGRRQDWSCTTLSKAAIAPDGRTAAVYEIGIRPGGGHRIRIIRRDGGEGKEVRQLAPPMLIGNSYFLFFSPDSKVLAFATPLDSDYVELWDVTTGEGLPRIMGALTAFSPDGKTLASGRAEAGISASIRDVRTGRELCEIPRGERDAQGRPMADGLGGRGWAFSPDGRILAAAGIDDKIRLWNLPAAYGTAKATARSCQVIENAPVDVNFSAYVPLAFSPDGRMLASSDKNNCVRVWETATGQERQRLNGHLNQICSIAFASDGRRLASGGKDTAILVWDVTGGKLNSGGTLIACRLSDKDMEALWDDVSSKDARRAALAIWTLASAGDAAVQFLVKQLKPARDVSPPPKVAAQLISDLDATEFQVRMRAFDALAKLGDACEPALRLAMSKKNLSVEMRRRLESLFNVLEGRKAGWPSAEVVTAYRAIEILGHVGTPAAKKALQHLAAGFSIAPQTQAAKFALERMVR